MSLGGVCLDGPIEDCLMQVTWLRYRFSFDDEDHPTADAWGRSPAEAMAFLKLRRVLNGFRGYTVTACLIPGRVKNTH